MKLSSKSQYGLEFLVELARSEARAGRPVTLKDVSERRKISEKYLWQVVTPLKESGLVSATPGVKGGYRLARPAGEITLRTLVEATEGGVLRIRGAAAGSAPGASVERDVWDAISKRIAGLLGGVSLQEILDRSAAGAWSYSI